MGKSYLPARYRTRSICGKHTDLHLDDLAHGQLAVTELGAVDQAVLLDSYVDEAAFVDFAENGGRAVAIGVCEEKL
ncbi:MAG: hypothetical protein WC314_27870 [Vulcanimicrobiota bacterium]